MSMCRKSVIFVVLMYLLLGIPVIGFSEEPNVPVYDPNDPNNWFPSVTDVKLKLWLSAYDLKQEGLKAGDPVLEWIDRSTYGTIFAPRDGMAEEPHYAEVAINGVLRPAIHFETVGAATQPGGSDRLWQLTNKGADNPMNSGPGDEFTIIAVWANYDMAGQFGSGRSIVTMRGTNNSPWMLGQVTGANADLGIYNCTYDTITGYYSGGPAWPTDTFGVGLMHIDSSNKLNFFQDADGNSSVAWTQTATQNAAIAGRNGPAISPETEGVGIGCHDQDCCGEGENFTGYICEIIIYGRVLSAKELIDIQAYLTDKYFRERLQPNAADTDLRLWLSAQDLKDQGMAAGDPVTQWVDKSTYGTIFAPSAGMNEEPHYAEVLINSEDITSPALSFGSNTDGSYDRLWQTNNKGATNPLNSGPGDELTVIAVWANAALDGSAGAWNPIITMRGTTNCPWMLGQAAGGTDSYGIYYVTYDSIALYPSGGPVWQLDTFGVGLMQIDSSNVLNFYQDYDGDSSVALTQAATVDIAIAGRNGPGMADPTEAAGIACHDQDCCGTGEVFVGNICEIFVYSKVLSESELYDIQEYLNTKYFAFKGSYCAQYPTADFNKDCRVDIEDFALFSQGWLECNLEPQSLCQ